MFKYSIRPYFFLSRHLSKRDYRRFLRFKSPAPVVFIKFRKFIGFVLPLYIFVSTNSLRHVPINIFIFLFASYFNWFFTLVSRLLSWVFLLRFYYKTARLKILSKPLVLRRKKNRRKKKSLKLSLGFFLICKRTRTNNYLTFVNKQGEVLYSISAGRLGIRKPWDRHRVPTFIRMVDRCYSFIRKRKITRQFDCILTSYVHNHFYTVLKRSFRFSLRVRAYRLTPRLVHGYPLKRKRIKRL